MSDVKETFVVVDRNKFHIGKWMTYIGCIVAVRLRLSFEIGTKLRARNVFLMFRMIL